MNIDPTPESLIELVQKLRPNNWHSPWHGRKHSETVLYRASVIMLTEHYADPKVVACFAYAHDCMRYSEDDDPNHGQRAAEFLSTHRSMITELDDSQFALLREACARHNDPHAVPDNDTLAVCWDADRLDLTRFGVQPDPDLLYTETAKALAEGRMPMGGTW